MTVEQLPAHLTFISDTQDVEAIRERLGLTLIEDYDSFFVAIKDGDYSEVWGMYGTVPTNRLMVYSIELV